MEMNWFLFCFTTREGSIICGLGTLVIGALRTFFLWFDMKFLNRLTETQIKDLPLPLKTLSTISKVQMSVTVVTAIVGIVLLIGIWKHKKNFVIPWIAWILFEELLDLCIIMFYAIKKVKVTSSVYIGDSILLLINIYCVLCVYSYLKQLKRGERQAPLYHLGSHPYDSDEELIFPASSSVI